MTKGPSSSQHNLAFVIWNLKLGSIKLYLPCATTIVFVSESSRNHLGKLIEDVLDYAIRNTGIESLSVEISENIKMPNIITKVIEYYHQCAPSKGHRHHIRFVAKGK